MKITKIEKNLLPCFSVLRVAFFPLLLCYLETVIHYFAYKSFSSNLIWGILFALGIGSAFAFLSNVFSPKVNRVLTFVFDGILTLVFIVQLVYFQIFKGFAPVSSIGMGAQAVTNFTGGMFEGIRAASLWIVVMLIPTVLLILAVIRYRPVFKRKNTVVKALLPFIVSVAVIAGSVGVMAMWFSGTPSLYSLFTDADTSTDTSVNCFGLTITMIQEIRYIIAPPSDEEIPEILSTEKYDSEIYQVDPSIDFEALCEKAGDNKTLQNLTAALSNLPVTKKNDYTGICEGYNLVAICAEAFSPEFISPELTPTLYKLSTNGFVFENFYSTFPNTTTNGEYTFCMGLFPDLTRTKTDSSFSISATNYLPYCYGNIYKDLGYTAKGYHNYVTEFYYRNFTHPNMGYDFVAANSGLDIEITWPSSDYDMMLNSVADYANSEDPFVAYYMTFSGHYAYNLDNAMSAKNWDEVKDLDASDAVKAYIACNLELEKALTHLMETLDEAGKADNTVIILTTDHFPYGLSDEEFSELAGRDITVGVEEKMRNGFICYVPGIEPVHVDSYCSSEDILPTVLNLFGFTYDSRLLAGEDILSGDVEHIAITADGSFFADGIKYDASSISFKLDENTTESRLRAEEMYLLVNKKFKISVDILNNNYYSFVYDRESTSEGVDNLTVNFSDVGIMRQSSVYFMLKNKFMDAVSEEKFGSNDKATLGEVLNVAYRIAGSPEVTTLIDAIPFTTDQRLYEGSLIWAYESGILDNVNFPLDTTTKINVQMFALILKRFADLNQMDTSVDEATLIEYMTNYPETSEEVARAAIFCGEHNLLDENGSDMIEVFESPTNELKRWYIAEEFYKICTYYLFE